MLRTRWGGFRRESSVVNIHAPYIYCPPRHTFVEPRDRQTFCHALSYNASYATGRPGAERSDKSLWQSYGGLPRSEQKNRRHSVTGFENLSHGAQRAVSQSSEKGYRCCCKACRSREYVVKRIGGVFAGFRLEPTPSCTAAIYLLSIGALQYHISPTPKMYIKVRIKTLGKWVSMR